MLETVATKRDFLSVDDLSAAEVARLLELARMLKAERGLRMRSDLHGKAVAFLFEKPSLRTRLSFDLAVRELGGHPVYLSPQEVGLGTRESIADVARVVSRYVHAVVLRTFSQRRIEEFARNATVPVINGLSDFSHPCQAMADVFTIWELKGDLRKVTVAYVGDGNNVAHSLILAAAKTGMCLRLATPQGYEPDPRVLAWARAEDSGAEIALLREPALAVAGADVVYTDVWTSMGQEAEHEQRRAAFAGYRVDRALLAQAKPDAIVMHDMPAHRGEEITDEVIDGPQSVVFQQAENRLHAQKAILLMLLGDAKRGQP